MPKRKKRIQADNPNTPLNPGRITLKPEGVFPPGPAAQGQLLTGGHGHPWPRGYSPGRMNEVREALKNTRIQGYSYEDLPSDVREKVSERWGKKSAEAQEQEPYDRLLQLTDKTFRRPVEEVIARADVPVEHLKGLKDIRETKDLGGEYVSRGRIDISGPDVEDEGVGKRFFPFGLIHEIGHHVSALQKTEHTRFRSARQQGAEEGFADRYAAQRSGLPDYPSNYVEATPFDLWSREAGKKERWRAAYDAMRWGENLSEQFKEPTLPGLEA